MGLPSGTLWANRNLDVTQREGFAQSPFQYGCSFVSWGNVEGHNPSSNSSFSPYSWGGINNAEPWYDGQVYGETPGNTLQSNIPQSKEYDAVRYRLGSTWHLPSSEDFIELIRNCDFIDANGEIVTAETSISHTALDKRVMVNGVVGIYLRSKVNGNVLFFPATGYGDGTTCYNSAVRGTYWSSTWVSERYASYLYFYSDGVNSHLSGTRSNGRAVRPVYSPTTLRLTRLNVNRQALSNNIELLDFSDEISPIERPILQTIGELSQNEAEL